MAQLVSDFIRDAKANDPKLTWTELTKMVNDHLFTTPTGKSWTKENLYYQFGGKVKKTKTLNSSADDSAPGKKKRGRKAGVKKALAKAATNEDLMSKTMEITLVRPEKKVSWLKALSQTSLTNEEFGSTVRTILAGRNV